MVLFLYQNNRESVILLSNTMKKITLLACTFLLVIASFAQDKPEGLFINSKAFDFKATDQAGNEQSLKDLRKKNKVVVLFYRGYWSPYCMRELQRFQDSLQQIKDRKAILVAITPEAAEGISKTVDRTKATFPILYDEDMKIAKAYQGAYHVDDRTVERSKSAGFDLLAINHQKEAWLPIPAVYIINADGSITYRFFDEDYKKRPSVKDILAALDKTL